MSKTKYKPKSKLFLLKAYWYNPLFWLYIIILPFIMFFISGAKAFIESIEDIYYGLNNWNLK